MGGSAESELACNRELGTGTNVIVERLLSISGEDWLTIDRKFKEPWSGKLNTRFVVVSNELPRFGDASGAIANRFVVLSLRRPIQDAWKLGEQLVGQFRVLVAEPASTGSPWTNSPLRSPR